MAEISKLKDFLAERQQQSPKAKIASTFRCTPGTWAKLQAIQRAYNLKLNETLEAIIEYAYENL